MKKLLVITIVTFTMLYSFYLIRVHFNQELENRKIIKSEEPLPSKKSFDMYIPNEDNVG
jgi:hypothetical protein